MNEKPHPPIVPVRFPLWWKVAVGVLFASLLVPYFLLRGGISPALARSVFERFQPQITPLLRTQAALPQFARKEPLSGAYYLNGMLVQFQTTRARAGLEEVVAKFEKAFKKTGYLSRRVMVQGQPTLVALHPQTTMLLTVRPSRDATGHAVVRLAQQKLSELNPEFRAEITDVPTYPGAQGAMLVQSADDRQAESLTFSLETTPSTVVDYYRQQMPTLGWKTPGAELPSAPGVSILEFEKNGAQCSVLVFADPESSGAFVMLTKTGKENV